MTQTASDLRDYSQPLREEAQRHLAANLAMRLAPAVVFVMQCVTLVPRAKDRAELIDSMAAATVSRCYYIVAQYVSICYVTIYCKRI